jgi:hypothetical protein
LTSTVVPDPLRRSATASTPVLLCSSAGGTGSSNPLCSSGESVSLPELLSRVENPGFPRGCARLAWQRVMAHGEMALDIAAARQDILAAGDELVAKHPDIGAIVLECTNMVPFARALHLRLGIPVYDIYSFVSWFHAGLSPRGFGLPGDLQ